MNAGFESIADERVARVLLELGRRLAGLGLSPTLAICARESFRGRHMRALKP